MVPDSACLSSRLLPRRVANTSVLGSCKLQLVAKSAVVPNLESRFESFWIRMHNSHRAAEIYARSISKNELTQIVLQGSQTDRPGVTPISNHARQGTLSASSSLPTVFT